MNALKIALDWTPNINHIGFFVAREKGYYSEFDLSVTILDPATDDYAITPAKKVEQGIADLALCPMESIISYQTKKEPFPMIAVAALLQEDLSAIVVKGNSGIESPKNLDGKIYSSYQARYEDGIVKEMIRNDGGQGTIKITYPDKLGIWNTLLDGQSDATWIFMNWEGVEVESTPHSCRYFQMRDYGIPYSYSPVIAVNGDHAKTNARHYKHFLEATRRGYLYCQSFSKEAQEILSQYIPEKDRHIDLSRALELTSPHFGSKQQWGLMKQDSIQKWLRWINGKGLEKTQLTATQVYTNRYLSLHEAQSEVPTN